MRAPRLMERSDLELEQPVAKWNILGKAEVTAALDVPIEVGESLGVSRRPYREVNACSHHPVVRWQ